MKLTITNNDSLTVSPVSDISMRFFAALVLLFLIPIFLFSCSILIHSLLVTQDSTFILISSLFSLFLLLIQKLLHAIVFDKSSTIINKTKNHIQFNSLDSKYNRNFSFNDIDSVWIAYKFVKNFKGSFHMHSIYLHQKDGTIVNTYISTNKYKKTLDFANQIAKFLNVKVDKKIIFKKTYIGSPQFNLSINEKISDTDLNTITETIEADRNNRGCLNFYIYPQFKI